MLNLIRVVLDLDDAQFRVRMLHAGQAVQSFSTRVDQSLTSISRMERALTSTRTAIRDFAITAASVRGALTTLRQVTLDWAVGIATASGKIERLQVMMEGFSSATSKQARALEAAGNVDFLVKMAKKVPFTLDELSNSFAKFKSVGIDPTTGSMQALTDAIARFGGSDAQLHRASVAIQQMAGKGVISMEELRQQLGEAIPTAMATMARAMNLTVAELTYKVGQGQVVAGTALKKFFVQLQLDNEGSAENMMGIWTGLMSRLSTGWMLFLKQIGDSGFYDKMKQALTNLVEVLSGPQGARMAKNIGDALVKTVEVIAWAVGKIAEHWSKIEALAKFALMVAGGRLLQAAFAMVVRSIAAVGAGYTALANAMAAQSIMAGMALGAGTASTALTGMARVMQVVRVATMTMLGPVGLVIGALASLGAYLYSTKDEAKELAKAILETKGAIAKPADIKTLEAEMSRVADIIHQTRLRLRMVEDTNQHKSVITQAEKDLAEAFATQEEIARAHATAIKAVRERQVQEFVAHKESEIKVELDANRRRYSLAQEALDKRLETLSEEQRAEEKAAILRAKAIEDLATLNTAYAAASSSGDNSRENRTWLDFLRQKIHDTHVAAVEASDTLARLKNEYMNAKKEAQAKQESPFRNMIDDLNEAIAGLKFKRDNPGATGLLAEIEAKIDAVTRKSKLAAPEIAKFKAEIMGLAEQQAQLQSEAKTKSFVEKLDMELASLSAKINETEPKVSKLREAFNQGDAGEIGRMTAETRELIEAKLDEIEVQAKLNEKLEEGRALEQRMVRQTLQMQDDAMTGREKIIRSYEIELAEFQKVLDVEGASEAERRRRLENFAAFKKALDEKMAREMETPMQKMNRQWQDMMTQVQERMTTWADAMTGAIVEFAKTGKFAFSDLIDSVISDLLRLMVQKHLTGPLFEMLSTFGASLFSPAPSATGNSNQGILPTTDGPIGYAKGGVFGPFGDIPMKMFANGGIADRPMMSIFGEGSMPEAYVPLPDGRTIPVTLEGARQEKGVSVQVNVINESGTPMQAEERGRKFDGDKMILEIVTTALNRPGSFRDSVRGAVR